MNMQRLVLGLALACGACLLAYRHGQLGASAECACGHPSANILRHEADALDATPVTEQRMISCMLQTSGDPRSDLAQALRQRLRTCLHERGALDPATEESLLIQPPPPPPPQRASAFVEQQLPPPPPRLVDSSPLTAASRAQEAPREAILVALDAARDAEELLPSAPVEKARMGTSSPSGNEWLTAAATAAASARLVTISCMANNKLVTLEPSTDWAQCAGDSADSAADLRDAIFAQETQPTMQLAFRHIRTGKYLHVVKPGEQYAWVVRAHATSVGPDELFEVRSGRGGHTFLFHVATGAHINHRFGYTVRGHGDRPGQPAGRIASARLSLRYYTASQVKAAHDAALSRSLAARAPIRQQLSHIHSLGASNEVRVISYGLYGKDTRYTIGVLRNAQLAPIVYPGWKVRVYLDRTVPADVVAQLTKLNVQLVRMDDSTMAGGIGGMFWRFLVAADATVDRFIVRDCDSRLNPRERMAVEEWVMSGKLIHSLRDHPNHDRPLNGGMWGGTKGAVADMASLVRKWSNRDAYMGDLDFLNQVVWPRRAVAASQMSHDAYSCHKYANARPFPTARPPDFQHVGQVFFGDGRPRQDDITSFMLNRQAPRQCRGDPNWKHG